MNLRQGILVLVVSWMTVLPVVSEVLLVEDFESQTIGQQPNAAVRIRPTSNTPTNLVEVVGSAGNPAGSGKAVRFLDDHPEAPGALLWAIATDTNSQFSALRADLELAPLFTGHTNNSHDIRISFGEYDNSMSSSSRRFINCRVYGNGLIGFDPSDGSTGTLDAVPLMASNNTLTIFVNDYDARSVKYTGPDLQPYDLPANSVAYWLNGNLQTFGGDEYVSMDLDDITYGGTIGTTENNLGRFGFITATSFEGLDYVFDSIVISTNLFTGVEVPTNSSWLVFNGENGLEYTGYANEGQTNAVNTVPDFSKAGYHGGGEVIPFIPTSVTVSPGPGDDTTLIQNAIDTVSALPVGANGFRGAVLLKAGDYTVANTLNIAASGVVIRGEGSQESGGTRITYTAATQSNLFEVENGGDTPRKINGTDEVITDAYVPVGATGFNVADASGFSPGDRIIVQNNMNQKWIDDISNMGQWGWTASGYQLAFRRTVTAINGNHVMIDAPVVQAIETQYGGGKIYRYTYSGEMENIGFEGLRLESTYAGETDENHGWTAIEIRRLQNGWVRQVTGRYFGFGLVNIKSNSQQITVEDCAMLDPKSIITGGRRYSFNIDDSQYILMQRCLTRGGRHDFASGSQTPGPNVFVDCRANETHSDIGPHHRYATGQIYDNILGGPINVQNRTDWGTGHGWAGAQVMFWNCDADSIICDAPTGAMSWCVGSVGTKTEGKVPEEPFGIWDSQNQPVQPRSLFYAQLVERLGANARNNIILPQQKNSGVWTELDAWGGNGLFLDGLVAWVDEDATLQTGEPVGIRGAVRNLQLLENLDASTWSKVSGPGTVAFADGGALETTVQFSEPGSYVLELEASTGPFSYPASDNYESDTVGNKPLRAYEVRPTTPGADLSTLVVGGNDNIAGTGNAVRMLDDLAGSGDATRMSYRFAENHAGQLSAARIDFSFAPFTVVGGSSKYLKVSVGEYDNSMASSSGRFLDCRLYADGTIDFRSTDGPESTGNALLASNNTLNIFINDHDSQAISYTGPDSSTYFLQTNSVAYWLNGSFAIETLMQDKSTAGGTLFTTTNNIGRFGFVTYSSDVDLDYVIDDVTIRELNDDAPIVETANLAVEVPGNSPFTLYDDWIATYPALGASTNLLDDFEPDGMDNLAEYALGGNPVSNDASIILPAAGMAMDGGSNWLYYVYTRRADASARGLDYTVLSGVELSSALSNAVPIYGVAPETNGFEQTTHRISTDTADEAFMKLEIEMSE